MEKDGIALPDVDREDEGERRHELLPRATRSAISQKGEYVKRARRSAQRHVRRSCKRGKRPSLKNDGAEAWDLGDGVLGVTLQDQGQQHRPRRHRDARHGASTTRREGLPRAGHRQRGRALLRRREPLRSSSWRRSRSSGTSIRKMVKALQDATQRMKYAQRPGRRGAVRHDARRRPRALPRVRRGAGRGRDLRGPRRGRRRPHPRRRRHAEHAVARARGHPRGRRRRTRTSS